MNKGEYTPTEADLKTVEIFIENFEKSCFPHKQEEVKDWDKFKEAQEKYSSYLSSCSLIPNAINFYQSKAFPFIMKTQQGDKRVNFKVIHSEKEFKKFIKNGQYLIYRCIVSRDYHSGNDPKTKNLQRLFGVYYHKDFGKVGWLRGRFQFILQKFCSVQFLQWVYGIREIKFPNISINVTNKCDD
jgi:hypothetical protein